MHEVEHNNGSRAWGLGTRSMLPVVAALPNTDHAGLRVRDEANVNARDLKADLQIIARIPFHGYGIGTMLPRLLP